MLNEEAGGAHDTLSSFVLLEQYGEKPHLSGGCYSPYVIENSLFGSESAMIIEKIRKTRLGHRIVCSSDPDRFGQA